MPAPSARPGPAVAALVDALAILLFAIAGRTSHDEGLDLAGVAHTAWPFLAGAAIGWLIALAIRRRLPTTVLDALPVWASALVGGMLLRRLTGDGTALAFIIVAAIMLAILLLGWRAVFAAVRRRGRLADDSA